jgi:hypothetical protein
MKHVLAWLEADDLPDGARDFGQHLVTAGAGVACGVADAAII